LPDDLEASAEETAQVVDTPEPGLHVKEIEAAMIIADPPDEGATQ